MTRFQIDFDGVAAVDDISVLEDAMDHAMDALLERGVPDPAVGGALAERRVEVSFVVPASTTEQALTAAHGILRDVTRHPGFDGMEWTSARAEAVRAATRASL